jgi:peptidoglycan/LPS O-acetylase OafA/YrhL
MLLVVAIYTYFFWTGQDQKNIFLDLLSSALYLFNISWSWGWGVKNLIVYHTWSLGVEEQFYLFWPFILIFFLKLNKKISLINLLIIFILIVWVLKGFNSFNYIAGSIIKESIFMGCLLALLRNTQKIPEKIPALFPIVSLILLLYLGVFPNKYLHQINDTFLPNVVGIATCLLIIHLLNENKLSSFFSNKYFVFIGKISYSLYIWHAPVFRVFYYHSTLPPIVSFILKFSVTIILSLLSWYLVEKTARDFGKKFK